MNKYPRGKLNADDEGALMIGISVQDKTVIIDFGTQVKWIGLDKFAAIQLGQMIIDRANEIEVK